MADLEQQISQLTEQVKALSIAMSQSAKQSRGVRDATLDLKNIHGALGVELRQVLQRMSQMGAGWAKTAETISRVSATTNVMKKSFSEVSREVKDLVGMVSRATKTLGDYYKVSYETGKLGAFLTGSFDGVTQAAERLASSTLLSRKESMEFHKIMLEGQTGLRMSGEEVNRVAGALMNEYGPALDNIKDKLGGLLEVQKIDVNMFKTIESLRGDPAGLLAYVSQMRALHGVSEENVITMMRYGKAIEDTNKPQSAAEKGMRNLMDAQQRLQAAFADIEIAWIEKISDYLVYALNTFGSIVEWAEKFIQTMGGWEVAVVAGIAVFAKIMVVIRSIAMGIVGIAERWRHATLEVQKYAATVSGLGAAQAGAAMAPAGAAAGAAAGATAARGGMRGRAIAGVGAFAIPAMMAATGAGEGAVGGTLGTVGTGAAMGFSIGGAKGAAIGAAIAGIYAGSKAVYTALTEGATAFSSAAERALAAKNLEAAVETALGDQEAALLQQEIATLREKYDSETTILQELNKFREAGGAELEAARRGDVIAAAQRATQQDIIAAVRAGEGVDVRGIAAGAREEFTGMAGTTPLATREILSAEMLIQLQGAVAAEYKKTNVEVDKFVKGNQSIIEATKRQTGDLYRITQLRQEEVSELERALSVAEADLSLRKQTEAGAIAIREAEGQVAEVQLKLFETRNRMQLEALETAKELAEAAVAPYEAQVGLLTMLVDSSNAMTEALTKSRQQREASLDIDEQRLRNLRDRIAEEVKAGRDPIELRKQEFELDSQIIAQRQKILEIQITEEPVRQLENQAKKLQANLSVQEAFVAQSQAVLVADELTVRALETQVVRRRELRQNIESQVESLEKVKRSLTDASEIALVQLKIDELRAGGIQALTAELQAQISQYMEIRNINKTNIDAVNQTLDAQIALGKALFDSGTEAQGLLDARVAFQREIIANDERTLENLMDGRELERLTNLERKQALELEASIAGERAKLVELEIQSAVEIGRRRQELFASETSALRARLKFEEEAYFGIGATLQTRFKVIQSLERERMTIEDRMAEVRLKRDKAVGKEQQRYQKELNDLMGQQYNVMTDIVSLTRELREGYLGALQAFAVGAGKFDKIISRQEFGTRKLLAAFEAGGFGAPGVPQVGGIGPGLTAPLGVFGAGGLQPGGAGQAEYNRMLGVFGPEYYSPFGAPGRRGGRPGTAFDVGQFPGAAGLMMGPQGQMNIQQWEDALKESGIEQTKAEEAIYFRNTQEAIKAGKSDTDRILASLEAIRQTLDPSVTATKTRFDVSEQQEAVAQAAEMPVQRVTVKELTKIAEQYSGLLAKAKVQTTEYERLGESVKPIYDLAMGQLEEFKKLQEFTIAEGKDIRQVLAELEPQFREYTGEGPETIGSIIEKAVSAYETRTRPYGEIPRTTVTEGANGVSHVSANIKIDPGSIKEFSEKMAGIFEDLLTQAINTRGPGATNR